MNSIYFILFGIAWFIFAYFWWGGIIKRKVVFSNDENTTPSNALNDGMDYVPTKPSILFGHHFSSIAGAGPIIGPILAYSMFGWLPAMIWVVVGSVFMGAVHDYTSLMCSVRNKGISLVEITEKVVSKRARAIFGVFIFLTLTLVQAVFADLTAKTLAEKPEIVVPTFGVIFLALGFGWAVYRKGANVVLFTIIALVLLFVMIIIGDYFPVAADYNVWLTIAFIYCFAASTLPVWVLLQPRDYISMYILIFGMLIGIVGILILQPEINGPAFISFNSSGGPLFPMLFITVACGAISGFHSLVSSGTSAKQLKRESDGRFVAFGSMLTEGMLALLVILMISSVLWWAGNSTSAPGSVPIFQDMLGKSANIVFGTSLGIVAEKLGIPLFFGISFGVLMLNAFILTTLDTATRLNRYIIHETVGVTYGGIFRNKYFASAISLIFAYLLCLTGGYKVIWPVFGASNQLIATLALFVVTVYLLGIKAKKWFTFIPAILMLVITQSALIYQLFWLYVPRAQWVLASVSVLLCFLGFIVAWEVVKKIYFEKKT